jgi:hypothetical protein
LFAKRTPLTHSIIGDGDEGGNGDDGGSDEGDGGDDDGDDGGDNDGDSGDDDGGDAPLNRVSVRMALATSSLQYTCHMPMPNTIRTAPHMHRKTALPRRSSLKVWDLKIVSPTTVSSIRAPCHQSARVKALGS